MKRLAEAVRSELVWRHFGQCPICSEALEVASQGEDSVSLRHTGSWLSFWSCWKERKYAPMPEPEVREVEADD